MRKSTDFCLRAIFILSIILFNTETVLSQHKTSMMESFDKMEKSDGKTYEDALLVYDIIKSAPIANKTQKQMANNCENKAEFAFKVLESQGFKPICFWIFKEGLVESTYITKKAIDNSNGFAFDTKVGRKSYVFWGYHVGAGIIIDRDGEQDTLIYDPWTQNGLISLSDWSLSFFPDKYNATLKRTSYVMALTNLYKFYGTTQIGQVSLEREPWLKQLDTELDQMFCGLAGITPNSKCSKKRFRERISQKEAEIKAYLKTNNIEVQW